MGIQFRFRKTEPSCFWHWSRFLKNSLTSFDIECQKISLILSGKLLFSFCVMPGLSSVLNFLYLWGYSLWFQSGDPFLWLRPGKTSSTCCSNIIQHVGSKMLDTFADYVGWCWTKIFFVKNVGWKFKSVETFIQHFFGFFFMLNDVGCIFARIQHAGQKC